MAGRIGFPELKSAIDRARKKSTDRIPGSLAQYAEMLQNPNTALYTNTVSGDPFYLGLVTDDEGSSSVIFGSELLVQQMNTVEELHFDGTFKVRPSVPNSRQLLTVMSIHLNQVSEIKCNKLHQRNPLLFKSQNYN